MKRRILALVLALCLLPASTLAAENSTGNFIRVKTYEGQFSDLTADSVFYTNVSALYEYGLSVGKVDGTYGLTDSLTVGQAVIFAGRIRSLYRTGDPEAGPAAYRAEGQATAAPYLLYLQAEGVLDAALDDQLLSTATRAQMAHVLANLLPAEVLPPVHQELVTKAYAMRRFITDVTEYTPFQQDILALYRQGVSIGSDETGSFLPDAPISRGAVAAMLTRMVDPSLRMTPQWDLSTNSAKGTTLADLVPPGAYYPSPATEAEIGETVRYMLSSGSNQLTLTYPGLTVVQARQVMEDLLAEVKTYCEQSYNGVTCTFVSQEEILLEFYAVSSEEQTPAYRAAAMEAAIAVHDQLWADGYLTYEMTEWEKARVYFDWICANCVYDESASDESLSHIPYRLFQEGLAVCDGYTGAYNLFLKLEGIDCYALSNDEHIWTVATLDGTEYHIDATWGDTGAQPSYAYFAMTAEQSRLYHPW